MIENAAAQALPGWYPTPNKPGYSTYWDGAAWQPWTERQESTTGQVVSTVVQVPPKRVNHALHLILTVVTFGLWLPVWAIISIANS